MTGSRARPGWLAAVLTACGASSGPQAVAPVAPAQPTSSVRPAAQPAPPATQPAPPAQPAAEPAPSVASAAEPHDDDDTDESTLLGPLPRSGCFHVARAAPGR